MEPYAKIVMSGFSMKIVGRTCVTGKAGPVEHLLGEPVQPLVARLLGAGQIHLRDGHLGHAHDDLEIPGGPSGACQGGGRLQVLRRHRHPEVHAAAPVECAHDVGGAREVRDDDLDPPCAKCVSAFVIAAHQGAHRKSTLLEPFDHPAADAADTAAGPGHENRHPASLPIVDSAAESDK
jgi:hypothetical protein